MCGVVFAFRPDLEAAALAQTLDRAMALTVHRGPDDQGRTCQGPWAMGHRRLAVIDPQGSAQPFADGADRFLLSYNGELYNYQALRQRLDSQWRFQTRGDVEVVLAGMVTYGPEFLQLMEGMWALALWDRQARTLLLVRDRMGEKPLYYQFDRQRFACASEMRALGALSWFAWQEDHHSTTDYLRYGYYLPGTTAYRHVHEVLPGHWLRWEPGQAPVQEAYWRLSPGGFMGRHEEARNLLKAAVTAGVQSRLVADVEVGALLSGGVDSSLIVSLMTRHFKRPLKTFTMGFSDPSFDERGFARRMARRCGTTHFEGRFDAHDSQQLIPLVLQNVGQPFADASLLPMALVCRLAARHVKVVVSGDGGDELFSGYQRYLARSLLRWYTRLPGAFQDQVRRLISAFPEPGAHHSASLLKKAHLFLDTSRRMTAETPYVAPRYYCAADLRRLVPDLWRQGHPPPKLPPATTWDDLQGMMTADALIYLPQDILCKADRASMAFSLEVRAPFLDRRVVELAFAMPRHWHRWGWAGKRMLRDSFHDLLPPWVWRRRKHGFGVPVHQWFRSGLQAQLETLLGQTASPLNARFVRQMTTDHLCGRRDHGQRLWQLYVYLLWLAEKPWRPS